MCVNALMDTKKMIVEIVLIANQMKENKHFLVNIKMPKMGFGHMENNVMTQIMTQEMVVIIFRLLQVTVVLIYLINHQFVINVLKIA